MNKSTAVLHSAPTARTNLLANYTGRISSAAFSIIFVPLYVKFLGIEAFGLVGFYTTLIGVLGIFDLGISATVNRELAGADIDEEHAQRSRDLVKTLSLIYWTVAAFLALTVGLNAHIIALNWLNQSSLSETAIGHVIILMSITLAGQMLFGFYSAGLYGLQRHAAANIVVVCTVACRTAGATLILWLVNPTITAFFICQAMSVTLGLAVNAAVMHHYMPSGRGNVRVELLREVYKFALGAFIAASFSMLLYQVDKIMLSGMLPLKQFGYYAFAVTAAGILPTLANPIYTTYFSAFSRKVAQRASYELVAQYHEASQFFAIVIAPASLSLIFFARQVVFAWSGSHALTSNVRVLLPILAVGMALNSATLLTNGLQWAHSWTSLSAIANAAIFLALLVALVFVVPSYGAVGAASAWTLANAIYLVISILVMHRRILVGELRRWFLHDVGPAVGISTCVCVVISEFAPTPNGRLWSLLLVLLAYSLQLIAAVLVTENARRLAFRLSRRVFRIHPQAPSP